MARKESEDPSLELPEGTKVVILEGSRSEYGEKFVGSEGEVLKVIRPENPSSDFEPKWAMVELPGGPIVNFSLEHIIQAPPEEEKLSS